MESDDLIVGILAVLAALLIVPFLAMGLFMTAAMGGWTGFGVPGATVFVAILPLALLVFVGWLVYRLVRGSEGDDSAIAELREAYARGDITTDEFEERMERLQE